MKPFTCLQVEGKVHEWYFAGWAVLLLINVTQNWKTTEMIFFRSFIKHKFTVWESQHRPQSDRRTDMTAAY